MSKINEVMLNPVRMRIIQTLVAKQNMTTTEICEKISDVPRTTLYRHIKVLLDNNVLAIVSEQKIRGSLERTLAINIGEIVKHNTLDDAAQNAFAFLMKKYAVFQNYFSGDSPNPARDKIFLNSSILMMTDDEFDQFLSELGGLLRKYSFEYSKARMARDISIISAPEEK